MSKDKKIFLIAEEKLERLDVLVKKIGGLNVMNGILNETLKFKIIKQEKLTQLEVWKQIYKKYFNIDIDISYIEDKPNMWPIFVTNGLKIQTALKIKLKQDPVWDYVKKDLDVVVINNQRFANKDYVVWVAQNVEADKKYQNKSANDLAKINHKGITVLERILLDIFHFEISKGKHLDITSVTLCSGSRGANNFVFFMSWDDGGVEIDQCEAFFSDSYLCSREIHSYAILFPGPCIF